MSTDDARRGDWHDRAARLWDSFDEYTEQGFLDAMDRLTAELPEGSALAAYERGGAYDSTGRTELAIPLYRQALATGLDASRRRQATIQLASSLRALGEVEESVRLLETEREPHPTSSTTPSWRSSRWHSPTRAGSARPCRSPSPRSRVTSPATHGR